MVRGFSSLIISAIWVIFNTKHVDGAYANLMPSTEDECPGFIKRIPYNSWKLLTAYFHVSDLYKERIFGPSDPENIRPFEKYGDVTRYLDERVDLSHRFSLGGKLTQQDALSRAFRVLQPAASFDPNDGAEKYWVSEYLQELSEKSHFGIGIYYTEKVLLSGEEYISNFWGKVQRSSLYTDVETEDSRKKTRMCVPKFIILANLLMEKTFRDPNRDMETMTLMNWFNFFVNQAADVVAIDYENAEDIFIMSLTLKSIHRVLFTQFVLYEYFHGTWQLDSDGKIVGKGEDLAGKASDEMRTVSPGSVGVQGLEAVRAQGNMTVFWQKIHSEILAHESQPLHAPMFAIEHSSQRGHATKWFAFLAGFPERFARVLESDEVKTDVLNDYLVSLMMGPSVTTGLRDYADVKAVVGGELQTRNKIL